MEVDVGPLLLMIGIHLTVLIVITIVHVYMLELL